MKWASPVLAQCTVVKSPGLLGELKPFRFLTSGRWHENGRVTSIRVLQVVSLLRGRHPLTMLLTACVVPPGPVFVLSLSLSTVQMTCCRMGPSLLLMKGRVWLSMMHTEQLRQVCLVKLCSGSRLKLRKAGWVGLVTGKGY